MEPNQSSEPYRLLFPLGLLAAGTGILLWPLIGHELLSLYPRQNHGSIMYAGFLWSFISGFLMSAVPRMTFTSPATRRETIIAVALVITQVGLSLIGQIDWAIGLFAFQLLALAYFLGHRISPGRKLPFDGFIFLPFAFLMAILGLLKYFAFSDTDPTANVTAFMNVAYQAFALNLILGVGSRMLPVLMRVPGSLNPVANPRQSKHAEFVLFAVLLNLTFIIDSRYAQGAGRGILLAVYSYRHLKVFSRSSTRSFLAWGVRAAVVAMILGYFCLSFVQDQLATQHLVFISGFSLITLMVATRTTLTHANQSMDHELNSPHLLAVSALLIIAAATRLMTPPGLAQIWLLDLSAGLFLTSLGVWLHGFARYLRPLGP